MSTNISGYKLKQGTDIFVFSRKVREIFLPKLQKIIAEEYLKEWVEGYDLASFNEVTHQMYLRSVDSKDAPTMGGIFRYSKGLVDERMKNVAWAYGVTLGFMKDPATDKVYCHWSGSQELRPEFDELKEVEDYSYWNSTEHPQHVTEKEWEERRKTWDRMFLPSGHVPTSALMYSIASEEDKWFWTKELLDGRFDLPTLEERVRKVAIRLVEQEVLAGLTTSGEEFRPSVYFDKYYDAIGDVEACEQREQLVAKNIQPLTIHDLRVLHQDNAVVLPVSYHYMK